MRNESQTFIGIIKTHVIEWRKREGWSRETVVQAIIETHARLNGPQITGIRFEPNTTDAFERQKVNADRVFRWLDDDTKDNNLLPANFIPSVMAAMPTDIRLHCAEDFLRPMGITVHFEDKQADGLLNATSHLVKIARETSEAQLAVADLIDGATPTELATADRELAEAEEAIRSARSDVRKQMSTRPTP
jgi:hypothetical protein